MSGFTNYHNMVLVGSTRVPPKYLLYGLGKRPRNEKSPNDFAAPEAEHEADPDYNAKDHPAHGCRHEHVEFEPNLKR